MYYILHMWHNKVNGQSQSQNLLKVGNHNRLTLGMNTY